MHSTLRRHAPAAAALLALLVLAIPGLSAQDIIRPDRKTISPVFDGWYSNPDGSFTLLFGYFNRNSSETPIPIGPDNEVQPMPDDRGQPTNFLPLRQWHVFRVTVPAEWDRRWCGRWACPARATASRPPAA